MSASPPATAAITAAGLGWDLKSSGTPLRLANSTATSYEGPRAVPVAASRTACAVFVTSQAARNVPPGATSLADAGSVNAGSANAQRSAQQNGVVLNRYMAVPPWQVSRDC